MCTVKADNVVAAFDSMKGNNVVPGRINSAFIARINGDWTPNYSLSCKYNDASNTKEYMGLWILDPALQMNQSR